MKEAFKGVIEQAQIGSKASEKAIEKTTATISKLNLAAVMISLMLQIAAMEIEPRQIPAPLVRTKSTSRGKDGTLELQLYSAPGKIPDGNELAACIGSFLSNAFGVSFSFPAEGPISGAEMRVEGGQGFPELVLFNVEGTNSLRRWTDTNGVAEYKIFGAPQKRQIPDTAKEVGKEFSVHVTAQPEEMNLNSLLNVFFGGLTFGAAPSGASGLGSAVDIAKAFQYDMGEYLFALTDWRPNGYRATGRTADMEYSGTICDLARPFNVKGSVIGYLFQFDPSSATAGKVSTSAAGLGVIATGGGTYTIEGADTDKPRIAMTMTVAGHTQLGTRTSSGTVYVDLVPLETADCD